ncbi:Ankrd17 [Symbiodinium microadriaticum]|nr:Ankrd17 [Symbiodinium microadriaticum]
MIVSATAICNRGNTYLSCSLQRDIFQTHGRSMRDVWTAVRVWRDSGEEVAAIPLEEASDVKTLKQRLLKQCQMPRFRQKLFHRGSFMKDAMRLTSPIDVKLTLVPFVSASKQQVRDLAEASQKGWLSKVEDILKRPQDPDGLASDGYRALHYASANGHTEVVRLLLEAGAKINKRTDDRVTALCCAANGGHAETARLLLEEGADVNEVDEGDSNALSCAYFNGHLKAVWLLLEAGADMRRDVVKCIAIEAVFITPLLCVMAVLYIVSLFYSMYIPLFWLDDRYAVLGCFLSPIVLLILTWLYLRTRPIIFWKPILWVYIPASQFWKHVVSPHADKLD